MQFLNCKITLSFSNQKIKDRSETLINKGKYEVKIKFIVSLISVYYRFGSRFALYTYYINIGSKRNIRGHRVMLDRDIATFYGVETKRLNEKVKRNPKRFAGEDFMFQLTQEELDDLRSRSQIATLNKGRGSNIKYLPYAFTLLGVSMLSSVLESDSAIEANRRIMRAFVTFHHLKTLPLANAYDELKFDQGDRSLIFYFERGRDSGVKATSVFSSG